MGRHRTITTAALAVLTLAVPVSSARASSTLLSGYGGPGQGNQALLGSTLIGGAGNGGGGGATSSQAASSSSSSSATSSQTSLALPQPRKVAKHSTSGRASKPAASVTSKPAAAQQSVVPAAHRSAAGGGTLGLSGADAAYIAIALMVIALTALLTGRFTKGPAERVGRNSTASG
jgi:hypothetical protein